MCGPEPGIMLAKSARHDRARGRASVGSLLIHSWRLIGRHHRTRKIEEELVPSNVPHRGQYPPLAKVKTIPAEKCKLFWLLVFVNGLL